MKRHAPAAARNAGPIAAVLADELPEHGLVLEIASGTGEHAVFFAARFPALRWQPSDRDGEALASIRSWIAEEGSESLLTPIELDAADRNWNVATAGAILCVNMVHISPWAATEGLFAGAGRLLEAGAPLILYGPYLERGVETAPSNLAFDRRLRERDPAWGLRDLVEVDAIAASHGFVRTARYAMPANNLTLVYRKPDVKTPAG